MGRTTKIMGTLLQSEVAIRLSQSERLTEAVSRAMSMSAQLRHMIDEQIDGALGRSALLSRIDGLEDRIASLEAQLAVDRDQSSKASS